MSRVGLGYLLRLLVGPAIELLGVVLFLNGGDPGATIAGVPKRSAGLGLIAVGLVCVIVGLVLSRSGRRRRSGAMKPLAFDDDLRD